MKHSFWSNKRVLITGHTGFKGSWLSLWLKKLGAEPIGFALDPPTHPSLFEDGDIASDMVSIKGDIRDLGQFEDTVRTYRPEIVIHMAAQSLVRYSYENPLETYSTNIIGTGVVLEAVRKAGFIKAVLIITSDKCYKNNEWIWGYRESDPMGGYDPYSSSKGCAELITSAYRNSYFSTDKFSEHGVVVASARAGNVIGGGDWADDRLIPDIMKSILNNDELIIRKPEAIRPWQHVLEPLSGYLTLCQKMYENGAKYSGGWNFGPEYSDCKSVAWVTNKIGQYWGERFKWLVDARDIHPHEANYLMLDCSKAKRYLGWHPYLDLKTALEWVNEWYMGYSHSIESAREIAEYQILRYTEMLK